MVCRYPPCLCHRACQAAPAAAPADPLHLGVADAVAALAPVAVSSGARKEWLEVCCAAQAGAGLVLAADDIDFGHSVSILVEELLKHLRAYAELETGQQDSAPMLPATAAMKL